MGTIKVRAAKPQPHSPNSIPNPSPGRANLLAEQRLRLLWSEAEAARGRVHGARHAHSELDLVRFRVRFRVRVGIRVRVRVIYQQHEADLNATEEPEAWSVAPTQTAPER